MAPTRLQQSLTPARRKLLSRLWIVAVLIYDAIRAFIISETLSDHGVNGVWYFVFEVSLSIPYAMCSLRLILAIVDRNTTRLLIFGPLTVAMFFAPDIYIVIALHELSAKVMIIYGSILGVTTSISAFGIYREVRKKKELQTGEVPIER